MHITHVSQYLQELTENPWFGPAAIDYSLHQLEEAGLRPPVAGLVRDSRDNPAKFYGTDGHPYVKFTAGPHATSIRSVAADTARDAVLLVAMGSYAPMHRGHIAMMEAAEKALLGEGYTPLAAVFSLHSEEHVEAKIRPLHPDAPIRTETRFATACEVCPPILQGGTPTFIDRWDASMPGGPRSFTDVMLRLSNTLEAAEIRNVTPVAVFGSDNAVSMRAFSRYGHAVCVIRPKHEMDVEPYVAETPMRGAIRGRRVLVVARADTTDISSTNIRNEMVYR
ncbi:hypothetical protein Gbro_4898 (plasmid) [Gordonia bronchialis DSM 43247]|uniref:Cytidyltransferase-like domain-containing protein n=1 Tax=Gordonia bronchialis (strain ATCC 25592 / DSM 43247 / BCRC 13721 / JCM 3198 / KCTC 3076 / NBRC 16047 / NCTC 10667) TaxID=526226 RepID=D0LFG2_GORB4|nr:hypothetical protein [Gordonia bronchialis]ACY24011.1 hypothetical protein Gbro_4898 [Gordonia bronchialis DSM 43247]MCC3326017.1 hypothetical protein [Gordonia bronchialis]QGS27335.1 hypothetical protein FOB84_24445 [Gordonia bronchialis]STS10829.1 nicotinate (nicotinamide) nucleotide adenylyltransferase [Gordonia bronchialis]